MPRLAKELGPLDIKRLRQPGYRAVGGVPGLLLQITKTGARSWILRTTVGNKRREIGLGQYPAVGLALARQKAQAERDNIQEGVDPVEARAAARAALVQQQQVAVAREWTFRRCAEKYIEAMTPGWRSSKHAQQWTNTLATYAYPIIGDMPVSDITIDNVMAVIEPHWLTKNETINRVRNRIELVMEWATVRKYRDGENPARWKGNIAMLLAKRSIVAPVEGHQALAAHDLFDFMNRLRGIGGISARCLEFVVLTVARSGEARFATWAEIDWKTRTWHIPGERMKSGRNHRVPLSDQAISLLHALPRLEGQDLIFPSRVVGKPLSDMTLLAVTRRMKVKAVPHGFRASFSSWCAATTLFPFEVREMVLAHAIGNDTVGAYQRSDLFKKRRRLMAAWAKLLETAPMPDDDDDDGDPPESALQG